MIPLCLRVSERHRSTQRPRSTNLRVMGSVRRDNNEKTTAWHSSRLACKSHPFFLFLSSRRVQISGSVDDYPVQSPLILLLMCLYLSRMVDVSPNLAFYYYPTCPADRCCLASSEWFVVECLRVCCIFTHPRYDYARCRSVSCTVPWSRFNTCTEVLQLVLFIPFGLVHTTSPD